MGNQDWTQDGPPFHQMGERRGEEAVSERRFRSAQSARSPRRAAMVASWARLSAPSLVSSDVTCDLMVLGATRVTNFALETFSLSKEE